MKNIFRLYLLLPAILCYTSGCKELDINASPNNPTVEKATPESLFPSAVMSTVGRVGGELSMVGGIWAQFWTQSNTSSQFRTVDSYNLQNSSIFINNSYTELFSGALMDYQLGIEKAVEARDWRYNLMNTVMRAYTYQVLVDLYDKVPYTEASQPTKFLQPKFDDGYTIYIALIKGIDEALAKDYLNVVHTVEQAKTDFIFGNHGNAEFEDEMSNWKKFANTLKLKMYLRMVNAKPQEASEGIKRLLVEGAEFLDTNAGVSSFIDAPNLSNPFYEYNFRRLNTKDNLKASTTLTSWLEKNADPRAMVYFGRPNPVPAIPQGDYARNLAIYNLSVTPVVKAADPVWLISKAESYFMQAEALLRYANGNGAEEMYQKGLNAAFEQVGLIPGAMANTYAYPDGSFDAKLEAIIVQKWASLFGPHALEAFFEQNRTGYPKISPVYSTNAAYIPGQLVYVPGGVTGAGNFPRRFVFPDVEKSRNSNTPAEVPIYTKVWWGK